MGSDCGIGWRTPQIAILFDRDWAMPVALYMALTPRG
jgi:hypothetical protein